MKTPILRQCRNGGTYLTFAEFFFMRSRLCMMAGYIM